MGAGVREGLGVLTPAYVTHLRERLNTAWHKNAHNCAKCPKEGCPKWWTMQVEDPVNGSVVLTGCKDVLEQAYLNCAIGAGQGAIDAAETQAKTIVGAVNSAAAQLAQLESQRELKVLDNGS